MYVFTYDNRVEPPPVYPFDILNRLPQYNKEKIVLSKISHPRGKNKR